MSSWPCFSLLSADTSLSVFSSAGSSVLVLFSAVVADWAALSVGLWSRTQHPWWRNKHFNYSQGTRRELEVQPFRTWRMGNKDDEMRKTRVKSGVNTFRGSYLIWVQGVDPTDWLFKSKQPLSSIYFPVVLFIMFWKVVLTVLSLWMNFYDVNNQKNSPRKAGCINKRGWPSLFTRKERIMAAQAEKLGRRWTKTQNNYHTIH